MTRAWVRFAGIAALLLLQTVTVFVVLGGRLPDRTARTGAVVVLRPALGGRLEASSNEPFLYASGLEDGDEVTGRLEIRNTSRIPLAVRLRVEASPRALDRLLSVEVHDGEERLFRGPLGRLRGNTALRFLLGAGERCSLLFRIALPAGSPDGYEGVIADARVEAGVERKTKLGAGTKSQAL